MAKNTAVESGASPRSGLLGTTGEAVRLAKTLLRTARSGSLATIEPGTGWPMASRVGVATDSDGTPIVLLSGLAAHTKALRANEKCSLLLGYSGKGDPLAHPRLSIFCEARELEHGSPEAQRAASRYLAHQPKAELYATLGDFRYFALSPVRALLNAGFGKAYALGRAEILTEAVVDGELTALESSAIAHMNEDHAEAVALYARHFVGAPAGSWRLVGIDREGMDLADGDDVRRVWFETPLPSADALRPVLVKMASKARQALQQGALD